MMRIQLPQILELTPGLIRAVLQDFGSDVLDWQPSAERWSTAMVLTHLGESEVNCFRKRLSRIALEQMPLLEPYDQWEVFQDGSRLSAEQGLEAFSRERDTTLSFLRSLPAEVLSRSCQHRELGTLAFQEMLNEFAFHDMGHIRQILELIRARAYYPSMAGWRNYYQVHP
jgi:hypothetical protein